MDLEAQRLDLLQSIVGFEQVDAHGEQHTNRDRLRLLKQEYNQVVETLTYLQHGEVHLDPLVKLPSELWIAILKDAMDEMTFEPYTCFAILGSWMCVSRIWRKSILEAPTLWTEIEIDDSHGGDAQDTLFFLHLFLHLSQGCEISLVFKFPLSNLEYLLEQLVPHRTRIKSISFFDTYTLEKTGGIDSVDSILRFLSPLSRLTELWGNINNVDWLLEQDILLERVPMDLSVASLSLSGARNLRRLTTTEDIQSLLPLTFRLPIVESVEFKDGNFDFIETNPVLIEPKGTISKMPENLSWQSLSYEQDSHHFPIWLLGRLPQLVDLALRLSPTYMASLLAELRHLVHLKSLYLNLFLMDSIILDPKEAPEISPCPSVDTLILRTKDGENSSSVLEYLLRLSIKCLNGLHSLTLHSNELCSIYMSLHSEGFHTLQELYLWGNKTLTFPGENAWFPSSLKHLSTSHPEFTISQMYCSTLQELNMSWYNDNQPEYSISGWPQLQELYAKARALPLKHMSHQHLRHITLWAQPEAFDDCGIQFCRELALCPSNLPALESIRLEQVLEWDILFIMLERKNFYPQKGVARIKQIQIPVGYPQRFLKPLRDLLSGMYTKRPSNYDISLIGNADVLFDLSIPGCMRCHQMLRICQSAPKKSQVPQNVKTSLPLYPDSTQEVLLTWEERRSYWKDILGSDFGRVGSCGTLEIWSTDTIKSYL